MVEEVIIAAVVNTSMWNNVADNKQKVKFSSRLSDR